MKIEISKADAIHIMNWLNVLKTMCQDPKNGTEYLVPEIAALRKRLFDAYKPTFGDYSNENDTAKRKFDMLEKCNDQVKFPTSNDYWWCEKQYTKI